ncbi:hypothetical protein BUALT_Bualt10G0025500 [Buddleja alternifolia]|uniref:DUF659 domain-containing protein n=1 Tax=Buddleja alternifolia TaxID=168488 RepID=A0AAV6X2T1_9LAMI|nr:hypothetical protein BUALT_Bualt10G0025500 [Buddleja alternifolia]
MSIPSPIWQITDKIPRCEELKGWILKDAIWPITDKIPRREELKRWILKDALITMQKYVEEIKISGEATGCSILIDTWTDSQDRKLINILVNCPKGAVYLKSYDISTLIRDVDAMQLLIEEVVQGLDAFIATVASFPNEDLLTKTVTLLPSGTSKQGLTSPFIPPKCLFKAPQLMNKIIRVPLLLIFVLCLSIVVPEPLQTHSSRFPRSSMASDNFVQPAIPRFDGHYDHWSMLMENFLRSKDYWQVVSGGIQELAPGTAVTDAQRAEIEGMKLKDLKAKNYLFQAIDRSILETIICKDSSKQIWDSMRKKYQGTAKAKRQQLQALRADFETLRMKSGESVSDYFSRVMTIVNKMRIHGDKSDDVTVVEKILRSMTPKFNYVVCSIEESKDIDELSLDELQSSLLVHEHKLNQQDKDEHALKVSTRTYGGRGRGKGSKNQKYQQQQPSNQPRDSLGRGRGRGGSHFDARRQKPKDKSEIQCYRCKSCDELKGWILKDTLITMQKYVEEIKISWETTGCSILLDTWTDSQNRKLINILVNCPKSAAYLKSHDISTLIGVVDAMQLLIEEVVEGVGVKNVVQIITVSMSTFMEVVGKQIMAKHKHVFWTIGVSN